MFDLDLKLFADGADIQTIKLLKKNSLIKGFTTNPSLMRKAGIINYEKFSKEVIELVEGLPLSLEVFADDLNEMEKQAKKISSWGRNVYVKIPVMTTKGEYTTPILKSLSSEGVLLNVTAIMTIEQVEKVIASLSSDVPSIISVFAGRIADTGIDPLPIMSSCLSLCNSLNKCELLWASPREVLNIFQADKINCPIITVGTDLLDKLSLYGKNLEDYSRETVNMFYSDALSSKYNI
jgi:transaldolase